jgi:hypothetical protein
MAVAGRVEIDVPDLFNIKPAIETASKNASDVPLATYVSSIIQMLNRWAPNEQTGMFFKAEAFPDTVDQWNAIPLVSANDHPD